MKSRGSGRRSERSEEEEEVREEYIVEEILDRKDVDGVTSNDSFFG